MESRINLITLGVKDLQKSLSFYQDGLGLKTGSKFNSAGDGIIFFKTNYVVLALYSYDKLAEDIGPDFHIQKPKFSGITLAHNTRTRAEVDTILTQAEKAGGRIEKNAQEVFWGGYSGYFSDPDGHLWEVACGAPLHSDGSFIVE